MRALLILALIGCSNDVNPRTIPGGGVGDGAIDGEVNVVVIDSTTDEAISGATVGIGTTEKLTDAKGIVTFSDVEGAQTIAVKMSGYRSAVWVAVNGANVTIPLDAQAAAVPDQATLSGTITGWDAVTVPLGHIKAAAVFYSQSDDLGDDANSLQTPANGNICGIAQMTCNWTVVTRTGPLTLIAVIIDRDTKGTLAEGDDTTSIIGWAYKTGVTVEKDVGQTGLALAIVEAGNLETITVDEGTPPAGLPEVSSFVGIEVSADEVIQMPLFLATDTASLLAPRRSVFAGTATYRLTSVAQTTSGDMGAQSIVLRRGLTTAALAAGEWLVPPTGVMADRTSASFTPVVGAKAHSVLWRDGTTELLEITLFNSKIGEVDVPNLVSLPTSDTFTARVQAIGADFNVNDFSLEEDSDLLWGISAQPVNVP